MKSNAREVAVNILTDIYNDGGYNNVVLRRTLDEHDELSRLDKAFITQIVNGTLKNTIFLDYVISQFVKIKINKMDKDVLSILRSALYQLFFMDKVPESAICNEAVNISKSLCAKHLTGFINGVIRNIIRNKHKLHFPEKGSTKYLSIMYSYPEWLIKMWLKQYTYETIESLCVFLNKEPEVNISVNTLKISKEELIKLLEKQNINIIPSNYISNNLRLIGTSNLSELDEYKKGYFYVQDESSMLAIELLDPKEGENILDICAAPGGKSFYAAIKMNNKGKILSNDIYEHKVNNIREGAERLGLTIIDAEIGNAEELDEALIGMFDKVIVDAPCSGFGILRKKPDIKLKRQEADIKALVALQRRILENASKYVKDNGIILYSTCTLSKEENQNNIKWFTENFSFTLEDISYSLPKGFASGTSKSGYIEIMPHIYNMDGFFIALLRKLQ